MLLCTFERVISKRDASEYFTSESLRAGAAEIERSRGGQVSSPRYTRKI